MKKVLVCGGRDFTDRDKLYITLDSLFAAREWIIGEPDGDWLPDVTIISGCARGADTIAIDYAVVNWCGLMEFPADWEKHGKAAGFIRNQQMLDEGMPDLVVAFPGGKGTADMVRRAKKAGVEVIEVA